MKLKKQHNNNQSNNAQEGFSLQPVKIKLSTTQINLGKGDEVIVLLLFYNENKVIARTELFLVMKKK
jgi:hypothetical protein